jgi:hypothetical protein
MNNGLCRRSQNWLRTVRRPTGSICQPHSDASIVGLGTPPRTMPSTSTFRRFGGLAVTHAAADETKSTVWAEDLGGLLGDLQPDAGVPDHPSQVDTAPAVVRKDVG